MSSILSTPLNQPLLDSNIVSFLALLRAGLWEQSVRLMPFSPIDFAAIFKLAQEQTVEGIIAAGLEHIEDKTVSRQECLPFLKSVIILEKRNIAMNSFIGVTVKSLKEGGIYPVLIKGQGIAQCYSRPLWRSAGDVDFFFDETNYKKALEYLSPLADKIELENGTRMHVSLIINSWIVELHGTMHSGISRKIDRCIDVVQNDIFENNGTRLWHNNHTIVELPNPDNDVILVFSHIIDHFFVGGIGLRQIVDWCRLIWTYFDELDKELLKRRLESMGLLREWQAFATLSIDYLGMPQNRMPFYQETGLYHRKAYQILRLVLYTGNFGRNIDNSYRARYPKLVEKSITFFRRFMEFNRIATIFPKNTLGFFLTYIARRIRIAL